ncbi:MAG: low molecular weight phosphatase family protein [Nitrosopumilales archaeon CG15_BIG_FIL_POST_REV_8_21_14_020_33_23]|nr:MAG: low molecular weight phosphatase family protein [Nitrosopumilales archaeon CG11_big_fil_rev_8_21_14_0_20_33_24]PIW36223.1 MAG: low molecular weight phosphatase family protein [Nitrosopumilales archaeon CG15_BIG_FIL_POST_REV_8_21_14_020_33_23]
MRKILFVCVENAARSQMAEAFFKKYMPKGFEVISAGTKPGSEVNPIVLQAMNEIGINIKNQTPKPISQQIISESEKAVNMGCIDKESCPALFMKDVLDWQIPDPKGKPIEVVREIRDQIKAKVMFLIKSLEENN